MNFRKINAKALLGLIELLDELSVNNLSHVRRLFKENHPYFEETVDFLRRYSLIYIEGQNIYHHRLEIDIRNQIIEKLPKIRQDYNVLDKFLDSFSFTELGYTFAPNPEEVVIYADERRFLADLGAIGVSGNVLIIQDTNLIIDNISTGLSLDKLKKLIDKNQIIGVRAEEIVLELEKVSVQKIFPSFSPDPVLQVSLLNTELGYDILSLDDELNEFGMPKRKYIEVKAISISSLSFHWSSNEIQAAKRLGTQYYIYLVPDPLKFVDPQEIIVIKDAYSSIFENEEWVREEKDILFTKK